MLYYLISLPTVQLTLFRLRHSRYPKIIVVGKASGDADGTMILKLLIDIDQSRYEICMASTESMRDGLITLVKRTKLCPYILTAASERSGGPSRGVLAELGCDKDS